MYKVNTRVRPKKGTVVTAEKGTPFRRILEDRSKYDPKTNKVTYFNATKGWRKPKLLTPFHMNLMLQVR